PGHGARPLPSEREISKIFIAAGRRVVSVPTRRKHQLAEDLRSMITKAIPPSTAADATANRRVIDSSRKTIPPAAAKTGTLNCTVAAPVAFRAGRAVYQIA